MKIRVQSVKNILLSFLIVFKSVVFKEYKAIWKENFTANRMQ